MQARLQNTVRRQQINPRSVNDRQNPCHAGKDRKWPVRADLSNADTPQPTIANSVTCNLMCDSAPILPGVGLELICVQDAKHGANPCLKPTHNRIKGFIRGQEADLNGDDTDF